MSLLEYKQRIAWKDEPIRGVFHTHEDLEHKVDPEGGFLKFSGNTVVFRPEKLCYDVVRLMQRILYDKLWETEMLASELPAPTIHMTLHDLVSPEMCSSYSPEAYKLEVMRSTYQAAGIVEAIRRKYSGRTIHMVADKIVNMVSKSLALLLTPLTEEDYKLLLELYHLFDPVQVLTYLPTPHITLAYFKPCMLDGDAIGKAVDYAQVWPESAPVFEFSVEALTVQRFLNMQTYMDIPTRICFCCDGGLNRSVMAANILTHLAKERNLPVVGEARSAYSNTMGMPVSDRVWKTLEIHGIRPDRSYSEARFLEKYEIPYFTGFAKMSYGAIERFSVLDIPKEKEFSAGRFFYGVRDPEYGEVTYEQAYQEIYGRVDEYLKFYETEYRRFAE